MGQAVTNILKNAVESIEEKKKTSEFDGAIVIDLVVEGDGLIIRIADNGIGLPSDRQRIMEPYITNRATGSGLGLAIVRKLVQQMNSRVLFERDHALGQTTFRLLLPVASGKAGA